MPPVLHQDPLMMIIIIFFCLQETDEELLHTFWSHSGFHFIIGTGYEHVQFIYLCSCTLTLTKQLGLCSFAYSLTQSPFSSICIIIEHVSPSKSWDSIILDKDGMSKFVASSSSLSWLAPHLKIKWLDLAVRQQLRGNIRSVRGWRAGIHNHYY